MIEAGKWRWELERGGDLEEIWASMRADDPDERIPYWTELWPSSLALAQWLCAMEDEIKGRLCADLGCGLGLTALAGQALGARVAAIDYEPAALALCRESALLNGVPPPLRAAADWRRPAFKPGVFFRVWGSDIIYERRFIDPVLDFLGLTLAPDGAAWVAEPGRGVFHFFRDRAEEKGFAMADKFSCRAADPLNGAAIASVTVWELKKAR